MPTALRELKAGLSAASCTLFARLRPWLRTPLHKGVTALAWSLQEFYGAPEDRGGRDGGLAEGESGAKSPVAAGNPARQTGSAVRDQPSSHAPIEHRPAAEPTAELAAGAGRGAQPGPPAAAPGAAAPEARAELADVVYAWMLAEAFLPNPLLHTDMRRGALPLPQHGFTLRNTLFTQY